jgi:1-deoxy-D-xylulose 5-phosphate reductoisomerase
MMANADIPDRRSVDLALDNLRRETDYRFAAIDQQFRAQEAAVALAMAAAKEAVIKAELANEKQFTAMNEKIDALLSSMNTIAGSSTAVSTMVGRGLAVATICLSFVVFIVNYAFAK